MNNKHFSLICSKGFYFRLFDFIPLYFNSRLTPATLLKSDQTPGTRAAGPDAPAWQQSAPRTFRLSAQNNEPANTADTTHERNQREPLRRYRDSHTPATAHPGQSERRGTPARRYSPRPLPEPGARTHSILRPWRECAREPVVAS